MQPKTYQVCLFACFSARIFTEFHVWLLWTPSDPNDLDAKAPLTISFLFPNLFVNYCVTFMEYYKPHINLLQWEMQEIHCNSNRNTFNLHIRFDIYRITFN